MRVLRKRSSVTAGGGPHPQVAAVGARPVGVRAERERDHQLSPVCVELSERRVGRAVFPSLSAPNAG
jgi:hypothetical protein